MCSPSVQKVRKRRPQSRNDDDNEEESVDDETSIRSSPAAASSSFRSHPQTTTATSQSPLQTTTEHNTAAGDDPCRLVSSLTERIWQLDHLLCGPLTSDDDDQDDKTTLPQPAEQQICSLLRDDIPELLNQAFSVLLLQEESDDSSCVIIWSRMETIGMTLLQLLSVLSHSWFFLDETTSKNHIADVARQLAQSMIPRLIHEFVLRPQHSEFVFSQLMSSSSSSMEPNSSSEHGQEQAEDVSEESSTQLHHPSQLYHRLVGVFLHVCDNDNDDSHYSDLSSALLSALTLGGNHELLQHKLSLPEVYYLLQRTLPTALEQLNNHSSSIMMMQDPDPEEDLSSPAAPPSQIQIPNPSGLEHNVPGSQAVAAHPASSPMTTNDHGLLLLRVEQPPNDGATPHKNDDLRLVQWMVQLQICLLDRMISSSSSSSSIWTELQASIGGSIEFEYQQDSSYEEQQDAWLRQTQQELLELGLKLWQSVLASTTHSCSNHHLTMLTLATDLWHAQCHAASLFLVETTETERHLQHKNMMDDSKQLAQQAWEQWVTLLLQQQQHYDDTTATTLWKLTKLVVLDGRGDTHVNMNMQIMTDDEPQQRCLAYALVTCAPIWLDDDEHDEQTHTMILEMMTHPTMRRALLALAWTSSVSHTHLRPEHGERLMHWILRSSSHSMMEDPFANLFFAQAPWRQYVIQPQRQEEEDGDDGQQQPMIMDHSLDVEDDTTLMDVSSSSPAADDVVEKEHNMNNSGSPSDPMMAMTMMELSPHQEAQEQEQRFAMMMQE